jgi:UDPglucose 6-dehydrogenase
LVKTANDAGAPVRIVEAVVQVNADRKKAMAQKIIDAMGGEAKGMTVAVLGLAFKPNTDDMRDAPSLDIIPALQEAGATVRAFDPESTKEAREHMPSVTYCDSAYEAITGADALAILTEWDQFRALDLTRVQDLLKTPLVVDLRNIYDGKAMRDQGFVYHGIGRAS